MPMFRKLLIANRGEIACRVARTARRMGIRSVAVYSEADAGALHARSADESLCIGPAPARESYLSIERILAAARASGAQAIHPGYGFLSESAAFSQACEEAGIVFVGPPPASIRAMGSKSAAKARMLEAGVPLLPGYHGADQDPRRLAAEAARIGYPVLIKATAGGGGKGMRRVDRAADFEAALASCRREALSSFGSDEVLVEKYVLQPRHVEVQVFCDRHGGAVHLFERDCSVQRRHQKVIEEAPAPGMTAARRDRMGAAAIEAARAVGYVGAGTVEFLCAAADPDTFWFMEMNTRLQVEHPVTEMITGLDLVEWQLRVAAGERLPLAQEALRASGHAIEVRIYAEDPDNGFLPSTGTLHHFLAPPVATDLRLDAGVEQGDRIGPHYDPMIGKLIAWGEDREAARARLRAALGGFSITGLTSNIAFLARLLDTPSFALADLDTGLIERETERLRPPPAPEEAWRIAALALLGREREEDGPAVSPWSARDGWRLNQPARRVLRLRCAGTERDVGVEPAQRGWVLSLDGDRLECELLPRSPREDPGILRARIGARIVRAVTAAHDGHWQVLLDAEAWRFERLVAGRPAAAPEDEQGSLVAPMPGRVVAVHVAAGARVERGAPLLVVEAMKMEHALLAPAAGIVVAVRAAVGDQVEAGAELIELERATQALGPAK